MKNLIVSLLLAISLSAPAVSSTGVINEVSAVQAYTEWYEFILAGDQWYKVIHHDDGSETVIPVAGPVYD